eukprot:CAMPEP_0197517572 /NCGR_PEP_ID=MMETSP1318-20131121/2614_1 /TAXON_ID=552666 /ORGANISM="Partenskyella glossopodia, Strain RCC365" /LENGTH=170 /DNA_ID=CAMNT_0043067251 /DNA_START=163 /DNA_END=675 /DNA_ORIENTATION=+
MVGLDAAGKTTILYKLNLGEVLTTVPTIGFNVRSVEHKNLDMEIWDLGGQDKIRKLWKHYYENTDAVIFVIDSNDRARLSMARSELKKTMAFDELRNACVLVFANKQDLPKALSTKEISKKLNMDDFMKGRAWFLQGCCATSGHGLQEGMNWLASHLNEKENKENSRNTW